MRTGQMLPAAPLLDGLGFQGLETWGGAVIDSCLRYLSENPFDRLRALKKAAPHTPHLMLLRGQNIVQYTSFPDDVVELFVEASAKAGMDVFRVFDALNDPRNLRTAVAAVKKCGKQARGEICYTVSPAHTVDAFLRFGNDLKEMGCDCIGIKDMAGILEPGVAYRLVRELKKRLGLPVVVHSHDSAGLAASTYVAAVEAGAAAIETSIAPFANGTAQPDTQRMLAILRGHPRCPAFPLEPLRELNEHFQKVYRELGEFTDPANERVDTGILLNQVPGGMMSNFRTQLKAQNMLERLPEVLEEIPKVREALGWIPLVTPTSQIVGTQAMMNVKFGRWKMLPKPTLDVLLGKYGATPAPVDAALRKAAEKQAKEEAVEQRPADLLAPGLPKLRETLAASGLPVSDEHLVLWAMFPQELKQLHQPQAKPEAPPSPLPLPAATAGANGKARHYGMKINGAYHEFLIEELT